MGNEAKEQTEREKYIEGLQQKISKAVAAKRFNDSDEGKLIREWAVEQINGVLKQLAGKKFINDHNGYIYATGELAMAQKLLTMLDAEASRNTKEMAENLKAAKSGE
jgi:hypothetical protein